MKIFIVMFSLFLSSCSLFTKPTVIHTNRLYQTDYDYQCFSGNKTWSEIVVCLNIQNQAERAQNKITNDILDNSET